MDDKETIGQLRKELVQMQLDTNAVCQSLNIKWAHDGNYPEFAIRAIEKLRGKWARKEWERDVIQAELAKIRAELTDACAARDALAKKGDGLERAREYWQGIAWERENERDRARNKLTTINEAEGRFYAPDSEDHGVYAMSQELAEQDGRLAHYRAEVKKQDKKLKRAHTELKDLQGANRALAQQVVDVTSNREYWYKEYLSAEAKLADARADLKLNAKMLADQCDQAREAENILARTQKAIDWLYGYYDGNTLVAKPGCEDDIRAAWGEVLVATDSADDALVERLVALDAAEKALADCGTSGVFAEFDGLADAIQQMGEHIKNLTAKLTDAKLTAYIHELGERLERQSVHTERQLRRKAEKHAEDFHSTLLKVHEALDEYELGVYDEPAANAQARAAWLGQLVDAAEQRAERAEAEPNEQAET